MATDAQGGSRRLAQVGSQDVQRHTADRNHTADQWDTRNPRMVGETYETVHGLYDHERGVRHARDPFLRGRERTADQ